MSTLHHQILVLEDNDVDYDMIARGLARCNHNIEVKRFVSVKEMQSWLEHAASRASLAFIDLNLPGEDGHHIVKAFKSHPMHKTTPMLIFSTSASPVDVKQGYEHGVNSYHVKPLETPKFHELVMDVATYWLQRTVLPRML